MRKSFLIGVGVMSFLSAGEAFAGLTAYQGFESHGGSSGGCMAVVGNEIQIIACDADGIARGNVFYYEASGQIFVNTPTANGLCLGLQTVGSSQFVVANPCSAQDDTQSWVFYGGLLENYTTHTCMNDFGSADGGSDWVEMGTCAPLDTATNLWMPINLNGAMVLAPTTSSLALVDLATNYNSDVDDTALENSFDNGALYWSARIWKTKTGVVRTVLLNTVDQDALDLYGAFVDPNTQTGVVDMATPNGTPAQYWYFSSEGSNPQGYPLLRNGSNGQAYCLDIANDNQSPGNPVDLFLCDSQYGNGNNPAQLWQATLYAFPDSHYL